MLYWRNTLIFKTFMACMALIMVTLVTGCSTGDETQTISPQPTSQTQHSPEPSPTSTFDPTALPPSTYLPEVPRVSMAEVKTKIDEGLNRLGLIDKKAIIA